MIAITLTPLPETRSPERPCRWRATTIVAGRRFEAIRRSGASYELARALVAAGIEDQPVEVRQTGIAGCLRWPSLHRMAGFAVRESASRPVHLTLHQEWPAALHADAQNRGISPAPVHPAPQSEMAAV